MVVYQLFYFFFFPLLEAVMFRVWVRKNPLEFQEDFFYAILLVYH